MIAPADSTVPVIDDSNMDFDMESVGTNCYEVHNRSLPHFIADVTFPMYRHCSYYLLNIKLISKDEGLFKMLTQVLSFAIHMTVVVNFLL